jgi:hypothetical protein
VSAAAVAVAPPPSDLWTVAVHEPLLLATVVGFALLLAWLSYLVIAVLPTITPAAVRSASAPQRG